MRGARDKAISKKSKKSKKSKCKQKCSICTICGRKLYAKLCAKLYDK